MTFQDDNGNILDVAADIQLTKSAITPLNFNIVGDVSVNFSLPNTAYNRKILNYNGVSDIAQKAWTKQSFSRIHQGNIVDKGYIVIHQDSGDVLDCFYVTGNSNWISLVQGLITELDYSGKTNGKNWGTYNDEFTIISAASNTEGITFPHCDMIFDGRWASRVAQDRQHSPAFFLHSLLTEILGQAGLKPGGNIYQDAVFKSLVIPAARPPRNPDPDNVSASGTLQAINSSFQRYNNITTKSDPFGQLTLGSTGPLWTARRNGSVFVFIMITCVDATTVRLVVNPVGSASFNQDQVINGNTDIWTSDHKLIAGNSGQLYFVGGAGIQLSPGATIDIQVKSNLATTPNFRIDTVYFKYYKDADYILPNFFLPGLQSIDVIKFIAASFGCSVYFNQLNKTLSFNILDKIDRKNAEDWSEYLISWSADYVTETAKNNYIRVSDPEDSKIQAYNEGRTVKFGEANLAGQNSILDNREIYVSPFSPTMTVKTKLLAYLPVMGVFESADIGNSMAFTSISSSGGRAQLNAAAGTFTPLLAAYNDYYSGTSDVTFKLMDAEIIFMPCIRVVAANTDEGIFPIYSVAADGSSVVVEGLYFSATSTGSAYLQSIKPKSTSARILSVSPNQPTTDYSEQQSYKNSIYTWTNAPFATYCKPSNTGLAIDATKKTAAYDNPSLPQYQDPSLKTLFFNTLSQIVNSPLITAKMILPTATFQKFDFSYFIYIRSAKLTGYFYVKEISGYTDSNTPCTVKLYQV